MGDSSDARPGTKEDTSADQRYQELYERIHERLGEDSHLIFEMDTVVGDRLCDALERDTRLTQIERQMDQVERRVDRYLQMRGLHADVERRTVEQIRGY